MKFESITSAQNPKIKELLSLQEKSKLRKEKRLFVVEGLREIKHALRGGFEAKTFFICQNICSLERLTASIGDLEQYPQLRLIEVSTELYSKIAYREKTEGIVAEFTSKELNLRDLTLTEKPLILVAENVEKPGNLGAMLRSCDAAGADSLILCGSHTDLYNPNLIRASIGAVFTVPCVACSSEECIKFLKDKGISIITAQLQDSLPYYDCDLSRGVAIVVGSEAEGLSESWRKIANSRIHIPMNGLLDSLNVSVSAAILLYEALRQRRSKY